MGSTSPWSRRSLPYWTEMHYLDCTSHETALASVSKILQVTQTELADGLATIRWDDDDEIAPGMKYPDLWNRCRREWLTQVLPEELGCEERLEDFGTCWFHATRIPKTTDYGVHGLLPNQDVQSVLLDVLKTMFKEEGLPGSWDTLSTSAEKSMVLTARHDPDDNGPHGWLVREYLLQGGAEGRGYLEIPEYVALFCRAMPGVGSQLEDLYKAKTHQGIVKFRVVQRRFRNLALQTAVWYLHRKAHGNGLDRSCAQGVSCNGKAVPPEDVFPIEWL